MNITAISRPMAIGAAALMLLAGSARAAQDTDQLTVTATVTSGCTVSGATLAFGTYTAGQTTNLDVQTDVNHTNCPVTTLTFEFDGGGSGSVNNRRMTSGTNTLNYQLFRDAGRTTILGAAPSNAIGKIILDPLGGTGSVKVYGRIPANQNVPPGSYTDSVTITMTF